MQGGGQASLIRAAAGHRNPTYTSSSSRPKEGSFPSAKLKAELVRARELDASATGNTLKVVNANEDHMLGLRKMGRQLCGLGLGATGLAGMASIR